jgi:glycosyltransferase involved in cell wall biosynthesis
VAAPTNPPRIVIDGRALSWTGIGRYLEELLRGLADIDTTSDYVVLMRPQDHQRWQPTAANFRVAWIPYKPYSPQEQLQLPRTLRRLAPDLVHFAHPSIPLLYRRRFVTTVHDLTLVDYGSARPGQLGYGVKQRLFKPVLKAAISGATTIVTPTDYVRGQLVRRYGRPAADIQVIPEAGSVLRATPTKPPHVSSPYLLYVGGYYAYKNLGRLIEAFGRLADDHADYQLILAGDPKEFGASLRAVAERSGVAGRVIWTGTVSDAELAWLYQHATLFVFPSLSEGFGLPGLEAMGYGLPVAAAQASCLPEVYGDAAAYFDPASITDMARVVSQLLADPKRLAALKTAGLKRVKQFSWERMAKQTLAVYKDALEK